MALRRPHPNESAVERLLQVIHPYKDLIPASEREKAAYWVKMFIKARLMGDPASEISVFWSVGDVQTYRADLADDEAMFALEEALRRHRKELTHMTLACVADELYPHRYIYGTLEDGSGPNEWPAILSLTTSRVHLASTIEDLAAAGGSDYLFASTDGYFAVSGFAHLYLYVEKGNAYGGGGFSWRDLADFANRVRDAGVPIHHLSECGIART